LNTEPPLRAWPETQAFVFVLVLLVVLVLELKWKIEDEDENDDEEDWILTVSRQAPMRLKPKQI